MESFRAGQVVRVPFPYTDKDTRQHRPALIISRGGIGQTGALLWVLMITSAENKKWPGDIVVEDLPATGLPIVSLVRTSKIATIETGDAEVIGQISDPLLALVTGEVIKNLTSSTS
ncbi:type II toxin-antitoxin system PemK/MazF family toxin [Phyllobacterium sp. SB3]|uniref:type II toxin-antitoxin system PemK/MazF family toxin n=1 Tax=Phyllobacterium sp. SB3 TaxID=3156073 RepID=UPI0032B00552